MPASPPGVVFANTRTRRLLLIAGLLAAVFAAVLLSLAIGSKFIAPLDVLHALGGTTDTETGAIVNGLRLPRTLLGVLAGLALGIAGAVIQGHTRNPLADPALLGITQGAALGIVLAVMIGGISSLFGYVWFGFAGALIATITVFVIGATGRGGPTPVTLALAGAAVSYLLQGLISAVVLFDTDVTDIYRFWKAGSLVGSNLDVLGKATPFVLVGIVLALANTSALNALGLGEDTARSLGHRVFLARTVGIGSIVLLTGAVVAIAGPLGFVGLVVPHLARGITGPDYRWLVPVAGLLGVVMVLVADIAGRLVLDKGELPAGIMLAFVGVPFFIVLVRRRKLVSI